MTQIVFEVGRLIIYQGIIRYVGDEINGTLVRPPLPVADVIRHNNITQNDLCEMDTVYVRNVVVDIVCFRDMI